MDDIITGFFQAIYEATITDIPEFLVKGHSFDVSRAIRFPDAPGSAEILAIEDAYADRLDILRGTYSQVLSTVMQLPENLQIAGLHALSNQVTGVLEQLQLPANVVDNIESELVNTLADLPTPTQEELATVAAILEGDSGA